MDGGEADSQRAKRDPEAKLPRSLHASDVLPILHRLARRAPEGSEESLFAHRQLAELVAERNPWRASLHARRVLRHRPEDDRAWATLALCLTMMGHYRYAVTAYRNALAAAPSNPWYAHNLGHLLDVALDRAEEAVPWLVLAQKAAPWSGEMAASCAHALARSGRLTDAKRMASRALRQRPTRELTALVKWIDAGAPAAGHLRVNKGAPLTARNAPQGASSGEARGAPGAAAPGGAVTAAQGTLAQGTLAQETLAHETLAHETLAHETLAHETLAHETVGDGPAGDGTAGSVGTESLRSTSSLADKSSLGGKSSLAAKSGRGKRGARRGPDQKLHRVLRQGLSHLPLGEQQRERALEMARNALVGDGAPVRELDERSLGSIAAALAYAIVYVDRVPLTQAEVAACFRVSVSSLRGRFGALRTRLALTPGDVRWRTEGRS